VEQALREEGVSWREKVFTPALTLWTFLGQVLSPDGSCRAAVARLLAWLVAAGDRPCALYTGAYGKARRRLPAALLVRLARETGRALHDAAPAGWRWLGRRVKVVDGTTVSMPDTPANQDAYPQNPAQAAGIGFPLARLVVVFSLACGSVVDAALGRYQGKETGENSLLRGLDDALEAGDVVLGDRYFGGYFDLALWRRRGIDAVVRLHQLRHADFRRGVRRGPGDHVALWPKPARPDWLDEETYRALPPWLFVREVRVRVAQRGFRTRELIVVTTLLDAAVTRDDLAALYRRRWQAELNLRSLKVELGMDVLRCQSPELVGKEVWAHLLAYNLIRTVLAQAAQEHGVCPWELSFTGAVQTVSAFAERLVVAAAATAAAWIARLWQAIASQTVGNRPDRVEPRARKRRPKHYPFLSQPRQEARKAMRAKS
jgi:hypothetical protein